MAFIGNVYIVIYIGCDLGVRNRTFLSKGVLGVARKNPKVQPGGSHGKSCGIGGVDVNKLKKMWVGGKNN